MSACACGHEHDGACINCLCPEFHAELRMVPTLMNGRWELALPSHRAYRPEWTTPPYWEEPRITAMSTVIGPGDLVFDVGAEEADMGALWASWGADVVLIEPGPRVWPNARAIFEANGLVDRVRGWFVGFCGETPRGRPEWTDRHSHDPYASSQPRWPSCTDGPVIGNHGFAVISERPEIPVTTIDILAESFGAPTVITIDVEGAEATVLRGAPTVLDQARPHVFVSEHMDEAWMDLRFPGDGHERIAAYMDHFGYVGRHLATDHEAHYWYAPREKMTW